MKKQWCVSLSAWLTAVRSLIYGGHVEHCLRPLERYAVPHDRYVLRNSITSSSELKTTPLAVHCSFNPSHNVPQARQRCTVDQLNFQKRTEERPLCRSPNPFRISHIICNKVPNFALFRMIFNGHYLSLAFTTQGTLDHGVDSPTQLFPQRRRSQSRQLRWLELEAAADSRHSQRLCSRLPSTASSAWRQCSVGPAQRPVTTSTAQACS